MCPADQARRASPTTATKPPTASVTGCGSARTMKTAAHAKPSGTRQRCTHVPPLRATGSHLARVQNFGRAPPPPQSLPDRRRHALHFDIHTNPLRTRAAVTVGAAVDVGALDAHVLR